jgi:hypothetical protein
MLVQSGIPGIPGIPDMGIAIFPPITHARVLPRNSPANGRKLCHSVTLPLRHFVASSLLFL